MFYEDNVVLDCNFAKILIINIKSIDNISIGVNIFVKHGERIKAWMNFINENTI